ncbi:Elongator complex protein 4 [Scheffersomyces amazonensis]|uniref:Elongator complex protein 4 n=1 Tax=Scheffersomyces amazonensis TaxID=1078765 RepID=UPI00315DC8A9
MSFRKRSEIIGGGPAPARGLPGTRPISQIPGRSSVGPNPLRGGPNVRSIPGRDGIRSPQPQPQPQPQSKKEEFEPIIKNISIRPSLITSQPTISTGVSDLDKILLHQGLPLGNSLLVEESSTTDFSSVILRAFTSQGIIHNRINKDELYSHVIVVGVPSQWANDLPGLYKGSSKEQKKAKIVENESKISVSNLSTRQSSTRNENDLKIAWRYGLNSKSPESEDSKDITSYENYNHQFDITQKLSPGPNGNEISFIPISNNFMVVISQIEGIIKNQLKSNPSKIIRLVIPSLLNPTIYNPILSTPTFIIPFIHSLRAQLRKYEKNLSLIASISLELYPRDSSLTSTLENLFDSVIHLQPFNQAMSQLIERAYKNEPSKIQQGLVNIIKLPVLSEKGLMMIHEGEYAFKNGRKKFEIEDWGIPVEDVGKEEEQQTTKKIDF